MIRTSAVLVIALLVACVPKQQHNEVVANALQAENALLETRARVGNLEQALKNAEAANKDLTALTERLDTRNAAQEAQLSELSERVAELSERTGAQRQQKSDLEALLEKVRADAEVARKDAAQAHERSVTLAKERSALEAERDRLAKERDVLEAKTAEYDALVGQLQSEINAGEVTITELSGKLTVNLSNAILFDSGKITVKPGGRAALEKVAGVLAKVQNRDVEVEGHTDNVPVARDASYADNWALSALRASTVVALLVQQGVDPSRAAATGYGEFRPTAANDTPEHRAMNRRIEIVLVPRLNPRQGAPDAEVAPVK